jgi:CheY-like chemotaxis protein
MSNQSDPLSGPVVVLLVDDDAQILKMLRRLLLRRGNYHILTAASGEDALEISNRWPSEVHILVTDVEMGSTNGLELFARLRQQRPRLPVLFVSGTPEEYQTAPLPGPFLQKPFSNVVFVERLTSMLLHQPEPRVLAATSRGIQT